MHTEFWLFKFSVFELLITLEFFQKFLSLIQMLLIEIYTESLHALRNVGFHLVILRLYLFLQLALLFSFNLLLSQLILCNNLLWRKSNITLLEFLVNNFFDFCLGGHVLSLFDSGLGVGSCLLRLLLLNDLFLRLQSRRYLL